MNKTILGVVFGMLTIGAGSGTIDDPYLPRAKPTLSVAWDAPEDPQIVASAEIQIASDAGFTDVVRVISFTFNPTDEVRDRVNVYEAVSALGDGTYYVRVRLKNVCDVASEWSDWIVIQRNWTPPARPTGCRIVD